LAGRVSTEEIRAVLNKVERFLKAAASGKVEADPDQITALWAKLRDLRLKIEGEEEARECPELYLAAVFGQDWVRRFKRVSSKKELEELFTEALAVLTGKIDVKEPGRVSVPEVIIKEKRG
jgi:hypothetical protein